MVNVAGNILPFEPEDESDIPATTTTTRAPKSTTLGPSSPRNYGMGTTESTTESYTTTTTMIITTVKDMSGMYLDRNIRRGNVGTLRTHVV